MTRVSRFAVEGARVCGFVPARIAAAPSFSAIARRNDQSEASLRNFLSTLHRDIGRTGKMPNWLLADFQIDELVAYILSMKDGQGSIKF